MEIKFPEINYVFNLAKLISFLNTSFVIYSTVIVSSLYIWKFSERRRKIKLVNEFPGPKCLPIIGNGHQMLFKPTGFYSWSWNLCRSWGDPMKMWRLDLPMIFISSYETASHLLANKNFIAKSQDINLFWRLPGGNGLSSSPAHINHSRRKLLLPGYARKVVENSIYIFSEESKKLVWKLMKFGETGDTFEIMEFLMPCCFRIICRSSFGDRLMKERSDAESLEHMNALHTISRNFTRRIMSPYLWLRNDFIYFNLTAEGRKSSEYIKIINDFSLEAIRKRDTERLETPAISFNDKFSDSSSDPPPSYLDLLLDLRDQGDLKDTDVLGELNNYIVAGYDPTALTIGWTLLALATNPLHHQHKIFNEIIEILGENEPTSSNINKLKYLDLCIKESLRLYPVSSSLPRSTTVDIALKDGRIIPSGSDVLIMVDMIHRDPKYFPEPNKFIPERHQKHIPAFFPFSLGPRTCIGQMYAMYELKVVLINLIKEFIFETSENPDTIPRIFQALMVPANGIHFKITRRSKIQSSLNMNDNYAK